MPGREVSECSKRSPRRGSGSPPTCRPPSPSPSFDPNSVTPGWIGFVVTALIVVVSLGLIADMVRRMRRLRYRAEAQAKIAAEQAEQSAAAAEATETDDESTDA